jgi:hypothetical protein
VTRLLARDAAAAALHWRTGTRSDAALAALYSLAVLAESVDTVALVTNAAGMALSSGLLDLVALPPVPAEWLMGWAAGSAAALAGVLPPLPEVLAAADRISLTCAATACLAGLSAEALKGSRAMRDGSEGTASVSAGAEAAATPGAAGGSKDAGHTAAAAARPAGQVA